MASKAERISALKNEMNNILERYDDLLDVPIHGGEDIGHYLHFTYGMLVHAERQYHTEEQIKKLSGKIAYVFLNDIFTKKTVAECRALFCEQVDGSFTMTISEKCSLGSPGAVFTVRRESVHNVVGRNREWMVCIEDNFHGVFPSY